MRYVPPSSVNRRTFVQMLGAGGAAATLNGLAVTPTPAAAPSVGANAKIRLGLIGAGSRGNQLLDAFFPLADAEFVAVADVDDKHAHETAKRIEGKYGKAPGTMRDYRAMLDRKDLDGVVIATPDHWHALPTIHACQAGKDVYVEKPVGHNIAEGQAMIKAARKFDRVVAVGTQQRSSKHFQEAVKIVQEGQLGKVFWVQTWNFENISPVGMGPSPVTDPPAHVDWDRWLGPAPYSKFELNRFHLLFRWFFDYAGGMMSDWGVHLNDIVLWALKQDAPKSVVTSGGIFTTKDNRDTPDTLQVVYDFADNCTLTYSMRKGNGLTFQGRPYGILFCGTEGSLVLDRSGYEVIPDQVSVPYGIKLAKGKEITPRAIKLEARKAPGDDGGVAHAQDFLSCMASRRKPVCDIAIAHLSTNTCHLGNIAYRTGRKLTWDAASESFPNDAEANALLARKARTGFELPAI